MFAALVLAGTAAAYANTTTVDATKWVTIPCSTPTTVTYGSSTYTVTEATTLTVEDCGCTETPKVASSSPKSTPTVPTSAPALANGAAAGKVGAAAGVAAAIAYLI